MFQLILICSKQGDHLVLNWKNHDFEDQTTYNLSVRTTTDRWESPDSSPPTCLGIQLIQEVIRGRPAVFESEEALKKDDDFIVGYKCEQQVFLFGIILLQLL